MNSKNKVHETKMHLYFGKKIVTNLLLNAGETSEKYYKETLNKIKKVIHNHLDLEHAETPNEIRYRLRDPESVLKQFKKIPELCPKKERSYLDFLYLYYKDEMIGYQCVSLSENYQEFFDNNKDKWITILKKNLKVKYIEERELIFYVFKG